MTRSTDVFISLDQRLKMSRDLDADLFISLHADSIAQKGFAKAVRGATVYTLSERASDEEARRMAEKENNSDAIAGLQTAKFEEEGEVRNILIDLLKRETSNFSADFSNTLVKRLGTQHLAVGQPAALGSLQGPASGGHALSAGRTRLYEQSGGRAAAQFRRLAAARRRGYRDGCRFLFLQAHGKGTVRRVNVVVASRYLNSRVRRLDATIHANVRASRRRLS